MSNTAKVQQIIPDRKTYQNFIFIFLFIVINLNIKSVLAGYTSKPPVQRVLSGVSQIYSFSYSKDKLSIYYAVNHTATGKCRILKYNINNLFNNISSVPIATYIASGVNLYDRVEQINGTYVVGFGTNYMGYEVFYMNGTSRLLKALLYSVSQMIFSPTRQQLYFLYFATKFSIMSITYFLNQGGTIATFSGVLYNFGYLSPDQSMLAICSTNSVRIVNISIQTIVKAFTYTRVDRVAWNPNSTVLYVIDYTGVKIIQQQVKSPYSFKTYIPAFVNSNLKNYLTQIVYITQTNSIAFITQQFNSKYYLSSFNITSNLTTHYLLFQNFSFTVNNLFFIDMKSSSPNLSYVSVYYGNATATHYGEIVILPNPLTQDQLYRQIQITETYQNLLDFTVRNQAITQLNKWPGVRKYLKPIFTFFINFDDLQLYAYHQKQYNIAVSHLFENIQELQDQKLQTFNYQSIWKGIIGLNIHQLARYLNLTSKFKFSGRKFVQIQQSSNGYFLNTINFYLSNLILVSFVFLAAKMLFKLLNYFNFKIKQLFTEYRFNMFLILLILQGNVQYKAFLFGFQMTTLFQTNLKQKIMDIIVIVFFFIFIVTITSLFYLIKIIYKNESIELFQNFQVPQNAVFYLTFNWSIRNLVLGLIHVVIKQKYYLAKMISLVIVEVVFLSITIFIVNTKGKKGFRKKTSVWINIITAFSRIFLIFSFLIDFDSNSISQYTVQIKLTVIILICYTFMWLVSMVFQVSSKFFQIKRLFEDPYCKKTLNNNQNQSIKVQIKTITLKHKFQRLEELLENKTIKYDGIINQQPLIKLKSLQTGFQCQNNISTINNNQAKQNIMTKKASIKPKIRFKRAVTQNVKNSLQTTFIVKQF